MTYDFDTLTDRSNTNSIKWEPGVLKRMFGREDLLPLWVADMDFKCPQPVIEALTERARHGIFGYSEPSEDYYEAIIDWNRRRNNWNISKEWFVYTPGVVPAVNYLIHTFSRPGDKVIIQNPVYYPFANSIRKNGRQLVDNPLVLEGSSYRMDFEDLEGKAKDPLAKILILCSPHNPVGRVWTREELTRLGEICIENDVLVISDEIHSDLILKGHTHTPFAVISEDFAENSVVCTAPSKTFNLAGLQLSNIFIPNIKLRREFRQTMERLSLTRPNTFAITAATAAYREGEEWLEQLLEYLKGTVSWVRDFIEKELPGVSLIEPEGTYLAWLDFRALEPDPKALEKLMLEKAKIALDEGYIFGRGGEGFERINLACPRSLVEKAFKAIRAAV